MGSWPKAKWPARAHKRMGGGFDLSKGELWRGWWLRMEDEDEDDGDASFEYNNDNTTRLKINKTAYPQG